ncbi:hypothetical protein [Paludibacterium yongneupense]|uniref:hypothetical protein n=1 Tax=Paludibacterium yongneupense TaxID=400061 RepID=UPI00048E4576|nr:hypothetical protein [Paludibacterium yongneupense]
MTYINTQGQLYEGDCQPGDREATDAEVSGQSTAKAWVAYQAQAQILLDACDRVALRCWKAGVAFPEDWQAYDKSCRAIVRAAAGDPTAALPQQPKDYPANT